MRRLAFLAVALAALAPAAFGRGLLIPEDVKLPPLAMVNHKVQVNLEDQVAVTTVEQTFRNHTDRALEVTYTFPVPKGANVNKFTMWIDGKETSGELLGAKDAAKIYTDIVRRTQDPGLLEYMGSGMMRLKVFPVPAKSDQKVKVSFTAVAQQDAGLVEYIYPLKTDGKATRTLEEFSVKINISSQKPIQSIYSPTHAIDIKREGDKKATIDFQKNQATLDKDFQLFYSISTKEIGVTPVMYRPVSSEEGFFMLLITPQMESSMTRLPRDVVLVLDTSGSMSELKMSQAKNALKQLLNTLGKEDRFGIISFSTGVRTYNDKLVAADKDQLEKANKWVSDLRAGGGTAIQAALEAAIDMRTKDEDRPFTVVFFTDGQPTVGERDPDKIVKNVMAKNSANTRIFTFGVGDDVNTAMLDSLAETTKAVTTYVRPAEDIEAKASALASKINHPVMTNVKLSSSHVKLTEMYPLQLPDLFHGGQLVLFGRYSGHGHSLIKLTGMVGKEVKTLEYEVNFPGKTENERDFVENLWARRKVGFILDQIRLNGEQKELVDEVTALAKRYGIATPYTSYLVVPDAPMPVVQTPRGGGIGGGGPISQHGSPAPGLVDPTAPGSAPPMKVDQFAKKIAAEAGKDKEGGGLAGTRGDVQDKLLKAELEKLSPEERKQYYAEGLERARQTQKDLAEANKNYKDGKLKENQTQRLGVELAQGSQNLRQQERLTQSANRQMNGRNCVEIGGVWVDEKFDAKTKTVAVKALSEAYFRILELQPNMKDVFRNGNYIVWVTPSGVALVIDQNDGVEKMKDEEIEEMFNAKK